jgi:CRP-like cAMP-binding protein
LRGKGAARHTLLACMHRHLRVVGLRPAPLPVAGQPALPADPGRAHTRADDRAAVLAEARLLQSLSDAERLHLAQGLHVREWEAGTVAVQAGEPGHSMFVVAEGVLDVRLPGTPEGTRVNVLGPGSVFGEMALFTGEPRSATVRALCPCVVYEIDREQFVPLLNQRVSMVDELSEAVAQYQSRDQRTMAQALNDEGHAPAPPGMVRQLAARLRSWLARPSAEAPGG